MNLVALSRLQFAVTIAFHYIYPPISIGLGVILVIMESVYLKTKNPIHKKMVQFWVNIFALTFAIGVASGMVMEFQFGTNWATYSRFVGDVFGSALAAEGIFAFFLESGFLAVLMFGWDRVSPKVHFFSTVMVALGATFSAIWIIVANSWMQTPDGFHLVPHGNEMRAEVVDFMRVIFNPSMVQRLLHTLTGCWQAGAWLVMSVSAFYLIKKQHTEFAKTSMKIGLSVAVISSLLQLVSGHVSAIEVSKYQPIKLAAFEGHYEHNVPGDLHIWAWVDEQNETLKYAIGIPGMLSFMIAGDPHYPVTGLKSVSKQNRPPVNIVFQTYHLMIAIGMILILLSILGLFYWVKGSLWDKKWLLWIYVFSVLGPQIANQVGWATAEVGRQPWIVYGIMRTKDAVSPVVSSGNVMLSLIMFSIIYLLLFFVFIFLLDRKIKKGLDEDNNSGAYQQKAGMLEPEGK